MHGHDQSSRRPAATALRSSGNQAASPINVGGAQTGPGNDHMLDDQPPRFFKMMTTTRRATPMPIIIQLNVVKTCPFRKCSCCYIISDHSRQASTPSQMSLCHSLPAGGKTTAGPEPQL